jgi:hypothetical protein
VKKIERGKGRKDMGQDAVDLAALYRRHAEAIAGKTPVTDEQVSEAATLGSELAGLVKPKGARRAAPPTALAEALGRRDRLWTLIIERHRRLRQAGAYLWVEALDEHVPPLGSRLHVKRKKKTPPGTGTETK